MLLQFSETSPGIKVRKGNENTSDASRASKLSAIIPGDLPLACFSDAVSSIRQFDGDWNWASAEVRVSFPHLMTEAPDFDEQEIFDWLLEKGADPNLEAIVDERGFGKQTPLFNTVVSQSYQCGRQRDGMMAKELLRRGANPSHRATLKKAILFSDDDTTHEYRDVTPFEFGNRFSHQNWVNPSAMKAISELY